MSTMLIPHFAAHCRRHLLLLLILSVCCPSLAAVAQTGTVQGFVTGAESGEGLVGANVVLMEPEGMKTEAASTRQNGFYQISRIEAGRYVFQVSFVGYESYRDTIRVSPATAHTKSVSLRPTTEELDEVVVEAEGGAGAIEAGRQQVRAADVNRIPTPSPSGDIVAYLQSLPGVVSIGDRGGQLFVRGGRPSQNLVLMDGNLVYNPFHLIGFYSVFSEDLISNAEFYAGGFGGKYADRISSVLDVTMRPGNKKSYRASGSASPFVGQLRIEGPIAGDSFSFIASVRHSLIEKTAPQYLTTEIPLRFSDLYIKLHDTGESSQCALTALNTYDRGRVDPRAEVAFRATNQALSGRCALAIPGSAALATVQGGLSRYENALGQGDNPQQSASIARGYTGFGITMSYDRIDLSYGGQIKVNNYRYDVGQRFGVIDAQEDYFFTLAGYTGAEFAAPAWLTLEPSVAIVWPTAYTASVEPRFRAQATPFGNDTRINVAAGLYRQTLEGISDERDAGSVFTAWVPAPVDDKRARAIHAILGVERDLGKGFRLTVEGYHKWMGDLPVPKWSTLARFTTEATMADGRSYGADLRLEYEQSNFYAFAGYGLSVTRYDAHQDHFGELLGGPVQEYFPPHDQRHRLNTVVEYALPFLTANVAWQFSSGLPYTRVIGFDAIIDMREFGEDASDFPGRPRVIYDRPYDARLPVYHRLDVSLSHTFSFSGGSLELQGGAINMYDRRNVFFVDVFEQRRVDQLPVIPYVGVEFEVE